MEVGTEGTYLTLKKKKKMYNTPSANIILKRQKLKPFLREVCPLSPLLFNIVLEVLTTAIREEKEIRGIQTRK